MMFQLLLLRLSVPLDLVRQLRQLLRLVPLGPVRLCHLSFLVGRLVPLGLVRPLVPVLLSRQLRPLVPLGLLHPSRQ